MSYKIEKWLKPEGINFIRVALNHDQISIYGLDHLRNPDPNVAAKLRRDINKHRFMTENNGELFQIEIDAIQKNPKQFSELVINSVDVYYDESINQKNLREFIPKKINAYVKKKVRFID